MTTISHKESSVRRLLAKANLVLKKRPNRSAATRIYGVGYMIVTDQNVAVSGASPIPYFDSLEDVEAFASAL